jgi:hypothetical protein
MTTTETGTSTVEGTASASSVSRLRRTWEKVGTVLAVIGLVDVTGQLIKWATVIHWIAERYATARTWLFGWLPFHIPPERHDSIVLLLIFFSVTNLGSYQSAGYTFVDWLRVLLKGFNVETIEDRWYYIFYAASFTTALVVVLFLGNYDSIVYILLAFASPVLLGLLFVLTVSGFRWLLVTGAIFGALVAVNYAYVQWLEPLAEHR